MPSSTTFDTSSNANETYNSTQTWKQTFTYDRYGNRRFDFASGNTTVPALGCTEAICNPTINTSTNRLSSSGYSFDAAGNTTADAQSRTFIYDGENKQVEVKTGSTSVGQYWYDGDGKRVKKYVPASGEVTIFVYDAAGKQIAEYSTIVYTGNDAKVAYVTNDHLGSPRINTDADGNVTSRHDYLPFGEEITAAITSQRTTTTYPDDTIRKQFTGYERDGETDLDFAQARYYAKNLGRFNSVDPIMMKKSRMIDPQRINLYAYVRNNPFKFVDVSGEDLTLANAVAQQQARANIDKNLTSAAERANVAIQGNKVVLVNATGIDPTKASEGYKLLYEFINPNSTKNASYYGIQPGQTVTTPLLGTLTYQQVAATADVGDQQVNNFDFVVAVGANVETADQSQPNPQPIAFPEHLIFAHSLAHFSCGDTGMCAVNRENLLRNEQGLAQRNTTVGHTNIDANGRNITIPFYPPSTVNVQGGQPGVITTTPTVIDTRPIPMRKIEPVPTPPKKPNK